MGGARAVPSSMGRRAVIGMQAIAWGATSSRSMAYSAIGLATASTLWALFDLMAHFLQAG